MQSDQNETPNQVKPNDVVSDEMKSKLDSYFKSPTNQPSELQVKLLALQNSKNESDYEQTLLELKKLHSPSQDVLILFAQATLSLRKSLPFLKLLLPIENTEMVISFFSQLSSYSNNSYLFESISDYEESLFFLSDYLCKNAEILFTMLNNVSQNKIVAMFPAFSLVLHYFSKNTMLDKAEMLFGYLMHNRMEISTCAINNYIDMLCKGNLLEKAQKFFECVCDYKPQLVFPTGKIKFNKYIDGFGVNIVTYGTFIKWLCKSNNMELAMYYYLFLKDKHYLKDEIIYNLLIDGCSKKGDMATLKMIYFDMLNNSIKPTIVTFNTIIDAYVRAKDLCGAWKIFEDLLKNNIHPDNFTLSTLFRGIRHPNHKDYLIKGLDLVSKISDAEEKEGADIILINVLLDSCIALKESELMIGLFNKVTKGEIKNVKPDLITYNTFIKGCAQMGLYKEVLIAFDDMCQNKKVIPNDVTFNTLIDVFVRSKDMNRVWFTIAKMKEMDIKPDNFTYSTIIKGLNKNTNLNCSNENSQNESELDLAFKLFDNVKKNSKPDEILYNCIMDACLRFGKIDKMLELYDNMLMEGIKPSSITCGIVIKAYGMQGNLNKALMIYEKMINEKIEISSVTYGCLINACIKNDNLPKAFELYERLQLSGFEMNTILYTTLIKAYSKSKNINKVLEIFSKMKENGNNLPNNITYNSVIDCCLKCGEYDLTDKFFKEMCDSKNVKPDIITFSTLIKGALKNKNFNKAMAYFHNMIQMQITPDEVLLNSLLDGCEKLGEYNKAIAIFQSITSLGVTPTMMSYSIMMKIMGKLNNYQYSKQLIEEVKKKSKNISLIIFTCFIKTCFSTENIEEACETFFSLHSYHLTPDEIAYNTMINGITSTNLKDDYSTNLAKIIYQSIDANIVLKRHLYISILKYMKLKGQYKLAEEIGKLLEEKEILLPRKKNNCRNESNYNNYNKNKQEKGINFDYPEDNNNKAVNNYKKSDSYGKGKVERNPLNSLWERGKNSNSLYNNDTGTHYDNQKKYMNYNYNNSNGFYHQRKGNGNGKGNKNWKEGDISYNTYNIFTNEENENIFHNY